MESPTVHLVGQNSFGDAGGVLVVVASHLILGRASTGCLSRVIVFLALLVQQVAAAVLGMLVFGSAGVLGEAAIISAEDALIVLSC